MSVLVSVCLGGAIGLLYAGMAYLTQRYAVRREGPPFMGVVVGGMLGRMLVLLVLVGAILALVPVQPLPFAAALVLMLLVGLGLDVWWMLRYLRTVQGRDHR